MYNHVGGYHPIWCAGLSRSSYPKIPVFVSSTFGAYSAALLPRSLPFTGPLTQNPSPSIRPAAAWLPCIIHSRPPLALFAAHSPMDLWNGHLYLFVTVLSLYQICSTVKQTKVNISESKYWCKDNMDKATYGCPTKTTRNHLISQTILITRHFITHHTEQSTPI